MDANLRDFVTSKFNLDFTGENRRLLLLALRDRPEVVIRMIANNIHDWSMWAALNSSERFSQVNFCEDPPLIVEHLKRYFASEIQTLPTSAPAASAPTPA